MIDFNAAWTPYHSAFSGPIVVVVKEASSAPMWATYMSALATPVLAVVAAYIAYRQWQTARNKLKFDLYDRRFAVYEAARDLLVLMIPHCHPPSSSPNIPPLFKVIPNEDSSPEEIQRIGQLMSKILPAEFLFGEEASSYSERLRIAAFFLQTRLRVLNGSEPDQVFDTFTQHHSAWILSLEGAPAYNRVFGPYLRLSH